MWRLARGADHARSKRTGRTEDLRVYSRGIDGPRLQALHQVGEKSCWSAEIEIGVAWHSHLLEERHGEMTLDVIVDTSPIISAGPAVDGAEMARLHSRHQGAHLRGK